MLLCSLSTYVCAGALEGWIEGSKEARVDILSTYPTSLAGRCTGGFTCSSGIPTSLSIVDSVLVSDNVRIPRESKLKPRIWFNVGFWCLRAWLKILVSYLWRYHFPVLPEVGSNWRRKWIGDLKKAL